MQVEVPITNMEKNVFPMKKQKESTLQAVSVVHT